MIEADDVGRGTPVGVGDQTERATTHAARRPGESTAAERSAQSVMLTYKPVRRRSAVGSDIAPAQKACHSASELAASE